LEIAFCESFSLDLEGAALQVHDFGNAQPGRCSPVRFSDFKESFANFSAPTWRFGIEELIRKEQGRLGGMEPAVL
jgi:hypothetical protein